MEDFTQAITRLCKDKGWSKARLAREASTYEIPGTTPDTIRSAIQGKRGPSIATIEAISRVLEVNPDDFPIYRIQLARRLLDPAEVGEAALANAELLLRQMSPEDIAEEAGPPQTGTQGEDAGDAPP